MKKVLLPILVALGVTSNLFAQLQSSEFLGHYTVEQLQVIAAELGVPAIILEPEYEVDAYRLTYETPNAQGTGMTIATGAFIIPRDIECPLPLASYQHGTTAHKTGVPSFMSSEFNIGLLFGSAGYNICQPDYLGLGGSPGLHPYVHSKSEASATIDMIRASKEFAAADGTEISDQLMLFGYSQGGHATAAAQKEIQENHPDLTITLSVPMSGPYDVSGVQTDVLVGDEPYSTPGYLPYIIFAYQMVYGGLFTHPSDIFAAPYDTILPPLFDGEHSMGEINDACTDVPKLMLKPEVVDSFINDPNYRLWAPLRDNDLYDWIPEAPTRIIYCIDDDQVNYQNALVAFDQFEANGATDIEVLNLGEYDHGGCVPFALFYCKSQFDLFREDCMNNGTQNIAFENLKLSPNPTTGQVQITIPNPTETYQLEIFTINGQKVLDQQGISGASFTIQDDVLAKGMYFVALNGEQLYRQRLVKF